MIYLAAFLILVFFGTCMFELRRQDREIAILRLDLENVKRRVTSLGKQLGWDDDRAYTVMIQR